MPEFKINIQGAYEVNDAAKLLGKGTATIWRWIYKDKISTIQIKGIAPRRVLIPKSEIDRLKKELGEKGRGQLMAPTREDEREIRGE